MRKGEILQEKCILEISDVKKKYVTAAHELEVLKGIDFKIYEDEIIAVVGKSGVGKTTLLNILGLLDNPTSGKIYLHGREVTNLNNMEYCLTRNQSIGIVFQFYHLLGDFTALENVMITGMIHRGFWEWRRGARKIYQERALSLLQMVGLRDRIHHYPYQLSGGERQRVAIARALVNDPAVVLLDEPTGNLDGKTSLEIHDLLWSLQRSLGKSFVMVTHEESLAERADRTIRMVDGKIFPLEE